MSSVTITFVSGTGREGIVPVVIELDNELNNNRTIFSYGEKAYFRVYFDPMYSVYVTKTDGYLLEEGEGSEEIKDFISFLTEQETQLAKPAVSISSTRWLGNSLGQIILKNSTTIISEKKPEPLGNNGIGLAEVTYISRFKRYSIMIPERNEPEYSVSIYAFSQ